MLKYTEEQQAAANAQPALFINLGSVRDINTHLQNGIVRYSLRQLHDELAREELRANRSTVKKMIIAGIRKMERNIGNA